MRDEVPEWIGEWIDDVSSCWENMGLQLKFDLSRERDDDDVIWVVKLRLLPVELDSRPGETFVPDSKIDLLAMYDCFDPRGVEYMTFGTHEGSFTIWGKVHGVTVRLHLGTQPTDDAEVVDQIADVPKLK